MPTTCANLVHLKEVARAVSYCVWLEVIVKLITHSLSEIKMPQTLHVTLTMDSVFFI